MHACCGTFIMNFRLEAPSSVGRPSIPVRGLRSPWSLVAIAVLCNAAAAADSTLDPVVVSGTREPETLGRSASDIVVIDNATIRTTTADSVEDLVRRVAGMQVVRNGGPGQNSGFFIRGASTNSTVVLVDGVRVGSATLGQAEFEALSLAQIDRIEVLRGPASSLYGADAVGGVVQIFTRRGSGAPRLAAAPNSAATTRRAATLRRAARSAHGTTRSRSASRRAPASRRSHPTTSSATSIPTATAFAASRATSTSASRPRPGTGSASTSSRRG
jgi:outer membrane receptor protein involved in Fe transport